MLSTSVLPDHIKSLSSQLATQAIKFLENNLQRDEINRLDFATARVMSYEGEDRFFMVNELGSNSSTYILLEKVGAASFVGFRNVLKINASDLTSGYFSSQPLDGSEGHEVSWRRNEIQKVIYKDGRGKARVQRNTYIPKGFDSLSKNSISSSSSTVVSASEEPQPPAQNLPPVTFVKVVQSTSFTFSSLYFATNFNSSYFNTYAPPSNLPTASGGVGINPDRTVNVPLGKPSTPPSVDIYDNIKCFGNVAGAQYSIQINIKQPNPGTRRTFELINDVGHAWLTLEQVNPNGTVYRRNVGFYPQNITGPGIPNSSSTWKNNAADRYSVSLKIKVTGAEMETIKNTLTSYHTYNFESYNCTHAATSAFSSIGITLPAGIGQIFYPGPNGVPLYIFNGKNPGDLGEDIRGMSLSSFPAWRNVNRVLSYNNDQSPMPNTGTCL